MQPRGAHVDMRGLRGRHWLHRVGVSSFIGLIGFIVVLRGIRGIRGSLRLWVLKREMVGAAVHVHLWLGLHTHMGGRVG